MKEDQMRMMMKSLVGAVAALAIATTAAMAADISGAGATFPYPIYCQVGWRLSGRERRRA